MKKAIRKKVVKKVVPKPESFGLTLSDKIHIKLLVLQARFNTLRLRVFLNLRKFAAKLRGH